MKISSTWFLLLLPFAVFASEQESVRREVESGRLKPLSEIVAQVQSRHPGRILEVELENGRDGRRIYEIEVLSAQGNKIEVQIDAATGQFLDADLPSIEAGPESLESLLRRALAQWPGKMTGLRREQGRYAADILREDGSQVRVLLDPEHGEVVPDHDRAAMLDGVLPMPEMLERLRRDRPGQVLEAKLEREGRRWVYDIELRTPRGRKLELTLDAVTGALLEEDDD